MGYFPWAIRLTNLDTGGQTIHGPFGVPAFAQALAQALTEAGLARVKVPWGHPVVVSNETFDAWF
jgi:hypothetical protein